MDSTTANDVRQRGAPLLGPWSGKACKEAFAHASMSKPWTLGYASCDVDVLSTSHMTVQGAIPLGLRGTFYRNGPARHERGGERYGHRWDGDGMVHAFRIGAGSAVTHHGRFVQTEKFRAETAAGRFLVSTFGTHIPGAEAIPADIDALNVANISVCMAGPDLLALWEPGSAHRLDPLTLETRGIKTWSPELQGQPFSAHPKIEPDGTMWNFGANPLTGELTLYWIGGDGQLIRSVTLQVADLPALHDFAVTESYLVFPLPPILLNRDRLQAGMPFAQACEWRPSCGTRVLIVSKADWSTRWYELPATCIFHVANAWEDGSGTIRLQMMAASDPMSFLSGWSIMQGQYRHRRGALMTLVEIDLHGVARKTVAEDVEGEFPVIDPRIVGRRNREVFCIGRSRGRSADLPGYDDLVRYDVDSGSTQRFTYGNEFLVEEHVVVPASSSAATPETWVIGTALDMRRRETVLSLFHASSIADGPIARASLPYVLPMGLHGCFVGY